MQRHEVVGQQHRVEIEPLQAAAMRCCDLRAVARYADGSHEALLARLDGRVDRPAWAQRGVPLDRVGQVVQLPQIDVIHTESVERPLQLLAGFAGAPLAGLGRQEEPPRVLLQPGRDP